MTVYAITDTKKGRTGIAPTYLQTTPSYILLMILKTSIISPLTLLYFRVGKFNLRKRSLYGNFVKLIMSLVALF